ncbi:sugar ABC transporter ATP-binding protein [Frankia sp. CNm7]|uniref:Sugar ABC transporter ATP-binding protein n=1 Tax=Frankia nepalensis TaxID=1836974 RepID=A0A937RCD2_9ACTN|nr:ATP-binding cassette domain-containing protein [Frankia nepalensis]MBL7500317.1 sugar ABC transporter ATP-binding protein [Frankia nepalensis]MBL7508539.1 sugar ABC transporter ATP-binding protein [Frankia nepalensis]MBL7520420.1 sugar ABC transporter ATP-binding protein [Frankia nepalensis]MBL7627667.1 sugar ABC transporter ATP-binding protein [Frankia nepalensis]
MTDDPPLGTPVLELRGVNKSFGAVHVLHDVDFAANAGEVTALVGDNGAGKSTLIKCIGGIHPLDTGDYYFHGKPVSVRNPKDAGALGIEIVYQDLALCDNLDIVQNMFLGRERRGRFALDEASMEKAAAKTLAGLSVRTVTSLRQRVSSLSGGQRQTVAIAKAVLWNSAVVILDEPTAALGVAQTAQVLDLVRRLADSGLAVVLISHNMRDVMQVSDRICALYLGQVAADVRAADVTIPDVIQMITSGGAARDAQGNGTAVAAVAAVAAGAAGAAGATVNITKNVTDAGAPGEGAPGAAQGSEAAGSEAAGSEAAAATTKGGAA